MKTVQLFAAAVLSLTTLSLAAQQVGASASGQQDASASAGRSSVNESSQGNANGSVSRQGVGGNSAGSGAASVSGPRGRSASSSGVLDGISRANRRGASTATSGSGAGTAEMRPVTGELESKLDSKSSKPGDPVIVKTTRKMKTADGTEIPKGTKLIGHVTEAQAHAKGHANSALGIVFDRAELRDGRSIPIHSMIESVAPRPVDLMAASEGDGDMGAGMMGAGPAMGGGPAMAGGGMGGRSILGGAPAIGGNPAMAGGALGGAVDGAGSTMGRVGPGMDAAAENTMGATGRVAGNSTGMLHGQMNGAMAGSEALAAHATGIPGVMLSGDATGTAAGMLSATNRNVHLESGTQMVLGIAAAAQ